MYSQIQEVAKKESKRIGLKSVPSASNLSELSLELKNVLDNTRWRGFEEAIAKVSTRMSNDQIKLILCSNYFMEMMFSEHMRYSSWYRRSIASSFVSSNPELGDFILKNSEVDEILSFVVDQGIYSDVSILDKVAAEHDGDAQITALNYCSIEVLRGLKDSKKKRVQEVVFRRLGPVECLDQMLSSKYASVRAEGLSRAPVNYERLKSMTNEIARAPFSVLVKKISFDYLPMLLANRNVSKNSWMRKALEERMEKGV